MSWNLRNRLRVWTWSLAATLAIATAAPAQDVFGGMCSTGLCGTDCSVGCQTHHCPPPLSHCQEGPPRIRVRCGCPKPICNPCSQPGWGYFETCWNPWPWPPRYDHCNPVPPAATVALSGHPTDSYPFYGPSPRGPVGTGQPGQPAPTYSQPGTMQPAPILPSPRPTTVPNPSMPPISNPPIGTTPVPTPVTPLPTQPVQPIPVQPLPAQPMPVQPMPGGTLESLPIPTVPPRIQPNPGAFSSYQ